MLRKLLILGIVVASLSTLATLAAFQTSTREAEAQGATYELNYLCINPYTGAYSGSLSGTCPPNSQLLTLPDDYPVTLCASAYTGALYAPQNNGECSPPTSTRIDLPSNTQVNICYSNWTGRLRLARPYPTGTCGYGEMLVVFPIDANDDVYQTLGNVDIDVPASDGVLANDTGPGLMVTILDLTGTQGEVNLNPDGSFTYIPPAPNPGAFTGDDSFAYTVEDSNGLSAVVSVTIQVLTPAVWFVDSNALDPGDGRRQTPLNDISVLNDDGNDPDNPDDFIFLFESPDSYTTNLHLESGQYLVGQEVDLSAILQDAIEGSTLQGIRPSELPPFIVVPDVNPSEDIPQLRTPGVALYMADNSTAVGLTIVSDFNGAVEVFSSKNTTLDRVQVFGGTNVDGHTGVSVEEGSLTVIDSTIRGGNGDPDASAIQNGSTLQGASNSYDGNGGDGIFVSVSSVTVTGSDVYGGDGGGSNAIQNSSSLQSETPLIGDGGYGIFININAQLTVDDASNVIGGDGSNGDFEAGYGGHGIGTNSIVISRSRVTSHASRELQGPPPSPPTEPSFIHVSGASLVEGGDGGDGGDFGGFGGDGIDTGFIVISISESSTIRGGDGGEGDIFAGDGGAGIFIGADVVHITGASLQGDPLELTILSVDTSTVEGGNGADSDGEAGWGGDGIATNQFFVASSSAGSTSLQGETPDSLLIDVNASTITGGVGGASQATYGGFGGSGIFLTGGSFGCCCCIVDPTLQGPGLPQSNIDVNVTGSNIYGGAGGAALDVAGDGGAGIANGFPLFPSAITESPAGIRHSELQALPGGFYGGGNLTVTNSNIYGAAGGVAGDEEGGYGGPGIISFGPEFSLVPTSATLQGTSILSTATTVTNSTVVGGVSGSGYYSGDGGDGITALAVELMVDQGSDIQGGAGADSETHGGDGGYGIYAEESMVTVDSSTVTGARGGDNVLGSGGFNGGYGGEGIYTFGSDLTVRSTSQVFGGDGGDSPTNPKEGGDGIFTEGSVVTISDSAAAAGNGGKDLNDSSADGGHGIHVAGCNPCNTLTATNATITGGDGGSGYVGGNGGEGVIVENDNAVITGSNITGGNGGTGTNRTGLGASGSGRHIRRHRGLLYRRTDQHVDRRQWRRRISGELPRQP